METRKRRKVNEWKRNIQRTNGHLTIKKNNMNLTKAVLTFDDGSTQEFDAATVVTPTETVASAPIEPGTTVA